ncbi:AN1-type zinc finger protein 4-like [Asparagus officinalis]|uniref:AN1-type zinc finger protein 4-like n=1 Tax=Asparagus officinalis TaxID=4686 RepID=UPI00098DE336|nr:AN1-type zinc finger protein 4-like [Asparagus officinalis]
MGKIDQRVIREGTMSNANCSRVSNQNAKIFIKLETWQGTIFRFRVKGSDVVWCIKNIMNYLEGTPEELQILMHNGLELEDYRSFNYYNIKTGSKLHQRVKRYVLNIE